MDRRDFFKTSALGLAALGANATLPGIFQHHALAGEPTNNKRMVFIFQRGGNDALNTVIPRGDADYNSATRPTLFIPESLALDSGNSFAQFHPALSPLMEIYNHSLLNGQEGLGNLAVLHRIGYPNQSRSHFSSEQYWENGVPGEDGIEEGMIYRHLEKSIDLEDINNSFAAASISNSQLVSLKGSKAFPNFNRASSFSLGGSDAQSAKLLGLAPTGKAEGTGLMGLYGGVPGAASTPYHHLVHQTGVLLGSTFETVQAALSQGDYTPDHGAIYPDSSFGRKMEECAMLLKRTPVRVLGVNIGGWDTHNNQGQIYGDHAELLGNLAQGIQALSRDLQSLWDDLIIVTMTEFGRTSKENDSRGTDHAEATVMFAAGGGVKGGIYNCDASTWEAGTLFSSRNRYVKRRTDYRAIFAEIFTRHFGDDPALLNEIIPGYDLSRLDYPEHFEPLGFLG